MPDTVRAGGTIPVTLRVRNTSPRPWRHRGVAPVAVRYRLSPVDGATRPYRRRALERDVEPEATLDLELSLEAPEVPGQYRLALDLELTPVALFGAHLGRPLISHDLEVRPAGPADTGDRPEGAPPSDHLDSPHAGG